MIIRRLHGRTQRGGGQGVRIHLKNHKNIVFFSNTGPDILKNHKTTKPAFNVGPTSARQRNAIKMAFRWRANDDPLLVLFGSSLPSSKKCQSLTPSGKLVWIRALSVYHYFHIIFLKSTTPIIFRFYVEPLWVGGKFVQ